MIFHMEFKLISASDYAVHLKRLDNDSLAFRFGVMTSPEMIDMFTTKLHSNANYNHKVYGLFVNRAETPCGHLHICENGVAEIALGIEKQYQKYGLGKVLLANGVKILKKDGYSSFRMDCLKRNERIVRLIKSIGCEVEMQFIGSEVMAIVKIPE